MKNIFSIWQARKDSGAGFEELVAPHIDRLYRLGYRFSGTRHDAEDDKDDAKDDKDEADDDKDEAGEEKDD